MNRRARGIVEEGMQVLLVTLPASIEVISQPASKQAPASSYVSRFLKVKPQVFSESRAVLSGFEANPERCCSRLEVPLVRLFRGGLQVPGGLFVFCCFGGLGSRVFPRP